MGGMGGRLAVILEDEAPRTRLRDVGTVEEGVVEGRGGRDMSKYLRMTRKFTCGASGSQRWNQSELVWK
jgi:hypothetical protein